MEMEKQVVSIRDILGKFIHEVKNSHMSSPVAAPPPVSKMATIQEEEDELFNSIETFEIDDDADADDDVEYDEGEWEGDEEEEVQKIHINDQEEQGYDLHATEVIAENVIEPSVEPSAQPEQEVFIYLEDQQPVIIEMEPELFSPGMYMLEQNTVELPADELTDELTEKTTHKVAEEEDAEDEDTDETDDTVEQTPAVTSTTTTAEQYRRMTLAQLRQYVSVNNLTALAVNKLKKEELLKIIGV